MLKTRVLRWRTLLIWLTAVLCLSAAVSCSSSSDQNQQQVVLYCSVDQAIAEPIIAEFERQTGIKVLARFDTESSKTVGLVQRLRAEAKVPVADVFWSNEVFYTIRLGREGILASYVADQTKNWPKNFADAQQRWYGFALRARAIVYSTQRVSAEQAPKCLEDLLDSKWKGRLVMASPEFGTTGGDVASWFAHYGQDRAESILEGLKKNKVRLVEGNSNAVRMVATGQADVALTDSDDVYAGQRNGWPIAMNYLNQADDGVLVIPNTVALIAGAPHPDQARRLIAFLLSDQVEIMLAGSDSHNTPVREFLAQQFPDYIIAKPLNIDYEKVTDQLPTAIRIATRILR